MSPVSRESGTVLFGMDLAGWGDSEPVGVGCGERFLGSLCGFNYFGVSNALCGSWGEFLALLQGCRL